MLKYHQTPAKPTGELFGLEYLQSQSNFQLSSLDDPEDEEDIDEGLGDESLIDQSAQSPSEDLSTFVHPVDSEDENEEEEVSRCSVV